MAREHHVVDQQRCRSRREQIRQAYALPPAVRADPFELIVLLEQRPRRQSTSLSSDGLHLATKRDFGLQEPVARGAIVGALAPEGDSHDSDLRTCLPV